MQLARRIVPFAIASLLAACATPRHQPDPNFAPPNPLLYDSAFKPTPGAIYRQGGGMELFADQRARNVGDVLTITLSERTLAQSRSTTSTNKDTDIGVSASIAGAPLTLNGRDLMETEIGAERGFSGSGNSDLSNRLEGSLTVTVMNRLPNGNLVVRGEKLLQLNRSNEVIQLQGIVRPADIAQDNSVPSSRIADARIVYTGRGAMAQANVQGWLSRFFNSPVMP